jgi:homoserine kinase type II
MSLYSRLNDQDFHDILSKYDIGLMHSKKVLSGGSENTNYLIETINGSFVLTICEQKSLDETINLGNLLLYLNLNGFNTSKIIKTKKAEMATFWNQKSVMLKSYIDGNVIEDLPHNLLVKLGSNLSKLHTIKVPDYLPNTVGYGIQQFEEFQYNPADANFNMWLQKSKKYIQKHINADLPKALIHSDIFYNNIIISHDGSQATIMDFEEACHYYRIFDIGMMIVGTCRKENSIDLNKVTALLKGYQEKIKLLDIENKALQAFIVYAAAATGFWRYQNFRYVNVIPEMQNHYLEMKELADNVMSLPENCFI